MLGEHLPPLTLLCKDALGNNVPMSQVPPGLTLALKPAPPRGQAAELAWEASDLDVDVSADLVSFLPFLRPFKHVLHAHRHAKRIDMPNCHVLSSGRCGCRSHACTR